MQHIHPITGLQSVLERTGRRNKITRKAAQIPSRQFVYKFFFVSSEEKDSEQRLE